MANQKRISRKFNDKHVVWFEESNQWVAFEKPAYTVYKRLNKGKNPKKISRKISEKYSLEKMHAYEFVIEIKNELKKITLNEKRDADKHPKSINCFQINSEIPKENVIHYYTIQNTSIRIDYSNQKLAYYLHAPYQFYAIKKVRIADHNFKVEQSENAFCLFRSELKVNTFNSISELKHAFTKEIMKAIYHINGDDWFAWIHASAITNGVKSIIFSSESGAGKSTIATLLQSRGFGVLTDDMVFMNKKDCFAYPVPAALSIKEGSLSILSAYFPSLKAEDLEEYTYGKRKVRYIPPNPDLNDIIKPTPVSDIIFIRYKPGARLSFKKLKKFDSFQRFHKEAWMNGSKKSAKTFINWFESLNYYELEYSDSKSALNLVSELINKNSI